MTVDLADLDVYFHMVNHYKRIRNAKPIVDCSSPKGYNNCNCRSIRVNQCQLPPNCPRNYARSHSPDCTPKHPPCLPKTERSRCYSAPPHKQTQDDWKQCKQKLEPTATKIVLRQFAQKDNQGFTAIKSEGARDKSPTKQKKPEKEQKVEKASNVRKSQDVKKSEESGARKLSSADEQNNQNADIKEEQEAVGRDGTSKSVSEEVAMNAVEEVPTKTQSSAGEDEYIHFILKITEDILRNNLYTESGLNVLFESHVAANRGRLDEDKMLSQIENLKKELKLPISKSAQICECVEEHESKSADCRCEASKICTCNNPNCPVPKTMEPETDIPKQENRPSSMQLPDNVIVEPESKEPEKVIVEEEKAIEKDQEQAECIDPVHCSSLTGLEADNTKLKTNSPCQSLIESGQSVFKIVPKDDSKGAESQIIFYAPDSARHCFCNVSLQKTALKIQLEENDKSVEYILVDGPVCLPREILENKAIPVLIQNVSSMMLDGAQANRNKNEDSSNSHLNLFHEGPIVRDGTSPETVVVETVSVLMGGAGNVMEQPIEQKFSITSKTGTSISAVVDQDDLVQLVRPKPCTRDTCPKKAGGRIKKLVLAMEDSGRASRDSKNGQESCRESEIKFTEEPATNEESEHIPQREMQLSEHFNNLSIEFDELSKGGSKGANVGESQKPEETVSHYSSKSSDATLEAKTSSTGATKIISLDHESQIELEDKLSEYQDRTNDDEFSSQERGSDFAKKYHYLLVDAATSTSLLVADVSSSTSIAKPINGANEDYTRSDFNEIAARSKSSDFGGRSKSSDIGGPSKSSDIGGPSKSSDIGERSKSSDIAALSKTSDMARSLSRSNESKVEQQKLGEMKQFQYSRPALEILKPQMNPNELTYLNKRGDDLTLDSDDDSNKKSTDFDDTISQIETEQHRSRFSSSLGKPMTLKSKESDSSIQAPGARGHEGLKVRYSLNREELPTMKEMANEDSESRVDKPRPSSDFRKNENEDTDKRRFPITNWGNFEVRRVSTVENETPYEDASTRKTKRTCCGLVRPSKTKK